MCLWKEEKYQSLINKREYLDLNHFNDSKVFIEHLNDMDDIYKYNEECNPSKNKILVVFDDLIAHVLCNHHQFIFILKIYIYIYYLYYIYIIYLYIYLYVLFILYIYLQWKP